MKGKKKKLTAKFFKKKRKRIRKMQLRNKTTKKIADLFFVTEPSLFEDAEGTFIDYYSRKRVKVYLVPASWSRVVMMSLVYAFILSLVKYVYFGAFGKPHWVPSPTLTIAPLD